MSDHGSERPNETGINVSGVTVSIALTYLAVPLFIVFVYAFFQAEMAKQVEKKVYMQATTQVDEARALWSSERDSYGVVDSAADRYRIPVDEARKYTVVESKEKREAAELAARLAAESAAAAALEAAGDEMSDDSTAGRDGK